MNIVERDLFFSWFGQLHWFIRYFVVVVAVYIPAVITTLIGGTFGKSDSCDISFRNDYTFHLIWLLAIPLSLALLPCHYAEAQEMLCELSSWGILTLRVMEPAKCFYHGLIPTLSGVLIGLSVTALIGTLNISSIRKVGSKWSWWLPAGKFCPATLVFLLSCGIVVCIFFTMLFRYAYTVNMLRQVFSQLPSHVPTWSGVSSGPIWAFFRTFFFSLLPLALVPVCVWITRTFRGFIPLSNPVSILNMVAVPAALGLFLVVPITATGIPAQLRAQRNQLLLNNAIRIDTLFQKLHLSQDVTDIRSLAPDIEVLSQENEFVKKYHPTSILPPVSLLRYVVFSAIPAVLSVASALIMIVKEITTHNSIVA